DDPDASAMGLVQEVLKIFKPAVLWMNVGVVGDVVAVVFERRRVKWEQPNGCHAQVFEVIQLARKPAKVPAAIAQIVVKRADMDLVQNSILVPQRIAIDHQVLRY